jgi:hypothetical protein
MPKGPQISLRRRRVRKVVQSFPVAIALLLIPGCLRPVPPASQQRWQPSVNVEQLRKEYAAKKVKRPQSWKERRAAACDDYLGTCHVPDEHERIFGSR